MGEFPVSAVRFAAAASAALAMFAFCNPASAAQLLVTYEGIVEGGYDYGFIFGGDGPVESPSNILDDAAFVAQVRYDTDRGLKAAGQGLGEKVTGSGAASPALWASITVWGRTVGFAPEWSGIQNDSFDDADPLRFATHQAGAGPFNALWMEVVGLGGEIPLSVDEAYSALHRADLAGDLSSFSIGSDPFARATGYVRVERVTVAEVPEPSTWAVMVLGIGLAGGALRARRRQPTHATADIP